ncbi:MAG TPA: Hsp33 family molecular chaperone HslO [Longimicrobiales bacterium]|nr:Hsp33 family molecular chaperone HslO [Longimicrobiales bacterium]
MSRSDHLVRATALDGLVRALAIDATGVVNEIARRHSTIPVVTAAIGRLSIGALLFGAMLKEASHMVTLRMQGDGPAGTLLASANATGGVRGLVSNPQPDVEQVRNGKLNVRGAVGTSGSLTVTRDLGMGQPYVGTVEIVSGEVGEDIAHYLLRSEQVPSAVGIGVFVEAEGSVGAAGGYLLQLLPGVSDRQAADIEAVVRDLPHPTVMLRDGSTPEAMLRRIFGDNLSLLEQRDVRFECHCSMDRAERAIRMLGTEAIDEMIQEGAERGGAEVTCEFCTERYLVPLDTLRAMR